MNTTLSLHSIQVKQVGPLWGRVGRRMVGNQFHEGKPARKSHIRNGSDYGGTVTYMSSCSLPIWN